MYFRALLLLSLALPSPVSATTVRRSSEREMARIAATIVRGTVVAVTPWHHPSGLIATDVVIRVVETLKAEQSAPTVHFTQLGGTLDGVTLHASGQSTYEPGEEVLVFLERERDSLVEIGMGAGKYRVLDEHGQLFVERQLGRLAFATVEGQRATVAPPPVVNGPEPLADFEARITRFLAE